VAGQVRNSKGATYKQIVNYYVNMICGLLFIIYILSRIIPSITPNLNSSTSNKRNKDLYASNKTMERARKQNADERSRSHGGNQWDIHI